MFAFSNLKSLCVLIGAATLAASPCFAAPAAIQDNAEFFSDRAKSEASRNIEEMERSLKKELAIETFKEVPADIQKGVDPTDKGSEKQAIERWARRQAKQNSVNGVYILLVKTPPHLQVEVGTDTQKQAFTLSDRDTLVTTMLAKLRAKQFDEALLEGVSFVSSTMRAHAPGRARNTSYQAPAYAPQHSQRQSSFNWMPIIIGAVVIWVIFAIIRAMTRSGGGGGGMPMGGGMGGGMGMGGGGGGGGFFSSLLGGMFGAGAGMWLYDQFSGRGNSAFGADQNNQNIQNTQDPGYTGTDTDYTGSGGSFGDSDSGSSGGGDSGGGGGGDWGGGGDSGGGDSGGGGGDSGGGGDF